MKYLLSLLLLLIFTIGVSGQEGEFDKFAKERQLKNQYGEIADEFTKRIAQTIDQEKWEFYASNIQNNLMFFNKDRVKRAKFTVTLWVRNYHFDNRNSFPSNKTLNKILSENEFAYDLLKYSLNCKAETITTYYRSFHKIDGSQIGSAIDDLQVEFQIPPSTTDEVLYKKHCQIKEGTK